jgi:hypothetical protein
MVVAASARAGCARQNPPRATSKTTQIRRDNQAINGVEKKLMVMIKC